MRRLITASPMIMLLGLTALWAGCSSRGARVAITTPIGETVTSGRTSTSDQATDIPEWFLNPPKDPDYLYATATFSGRDLGMTLENAQNSGREDIASQIQVKVSGLFKRFREEVGAGEDAELTAMTTIVSQEVVSEVLSGSRAAKKDVSMEGSITWRAYVLMEMPIGLANASLVEKVRANKNMYTRFRASQTFKELEAEVEKYEQSKNDEPLTPFSMGEEG